MPPPRLALSASPAAGFISLPPGWEEDGVRADQRGIQETQILRKQSLSSNRALMWRGRELQSSTKPADPFPKKRRECKWQRTCLNTFLLPGTWIRGSQPAFWCQRVIIAFEKSPATCRVASKEWSFHLSSFDCDSELTQCKGPGDPGTELGHPAVMLCFWALVSKDVPNRERKIKTNPWPLRRSHI